MTWIGRGWRRKLENEGFADAQIDAIREERRRRARQIGGIAGLLIYFGPPDPWRDMPWDGSAAHAKALDEYNKDHSMSDANTTIGRPF